MEHNQTHDHNQNTHSLTCSVEGCNYKMEVHAHNDDEAAEKIAALAKVHNEQDHPEMPKMEMEELTAVVKGRLEETK